MCRSLADGGQRCAAHTRPAYEAATFGTPAWDEAAAAYASTPTGMTQLQGEWHQAAADGDIERAVALGHALERGQDRRAANVEAATQIAATRPAATPEAQARYADLFQQRLALQDRIHAASQAVRDSADAHAVGELDAQLAAVEAEMASLETWRRAPSGPADQVATADDEALAQAYMDFQGPGPEPTSPYDEEGWFLDDQGQQWGYCNACGEEKQPHESCCDDGEIVPSQDAA